MSPPLASIDAVRYTRIDHLLRFHAERAPEAVAIVAPGRAPLTFGALCAQLDATSRSLRALGVGPGERVAIVLPSGPELALAFIAVAANATAIPLNPSYRAPEFAAYLAHVGATALLFQAGGASPAAAEARALGLPIITLTPATQAGGLVTLDGAPTGRPVDTRSVGRDDVALVLHTGGTTAQPKLAPLTHGNLLAGVRHFARALRLEPRDRCLDVMPLYHVHGLVNAMLCSLCAGASVICPPAFDPARFFDWIEEFRPTWYTAAPTMHQAVLESADAHRDAIAAHPLRFIRSASGPLPRQLIARLEDVFEAPLIETYGMTEAPLMTANPLPPGTRKAGSVGVAAGVEVAIVDPAGSRLPPGESGEIVVRGEAVISRYEGDVAVNDSGFISEIEQCSEGDAAAPHSGDNAVTSHTGSNAAAPRAWLRTGDLGYLDADGYLFITGRTKEMINRGGEKIAPREVEEVLLDHPAVAAAAAFPVPHSTLGEAVAAAVVPRAGQAVSERDLRAFVATRLAAFKVPARVLVLDRIPAGPTGKVRRLTLAEALGLGASDVGVHAAPPDHVPRTPLEAELAALWSEVLHGVDVGTDDDFFALGGDSLLAAQLLARVRQVYGVELPLLALFAEASTVAAMAATITAAYRRAEAPATAPTPGDAAPAPTGFDAGAAPAVPGFDGEVVPDSPRLAEGDAAEHLVQIQGGSRTPLYFLSGDLQFGGFFCYEMARYLDPEQPLYALQPHGFGHGEVPATIEAMASDHLARIYARQLQGPYRLAGNCRAGLIVFEMARQLQQQGHAVELLALIRSTALNSRYAALHDLIDRGGAMLGLAAERRRAVYVRARRCAMLWYGLTRWEVGPLAALARAPRRTGLRGLADLGRQMAARAFDHDAVPAIFDPGNDLARLRYARARAIYVPRRYHGCVTLLWPCDDPLPSPGDPTLGWSTVADQVEVHLIPGAHVSCIREHLRELTEQLNACLDGLSTT